MPRRNLQLVLVGALVLILAASLLFSVWRLHSLEEVATREIKISMWVTSQPLVELLKLRNAVAGFQGGADGTYTADEVREHFETLRSRIQLSHGRPPGRNSRGNRRRRSGEPEPGCRPRADTARYPIHRAGRRHGSAPAPGETQLAGAGVERAAPERLSTNQCPARSAHVRAAGDPNADPRDAPRHDSRRRGARGVAGEAVESAPPSSWRAPGARRRRCISVSGPWRQPATAS